MHMYPDLWDGLQSVPISEGWLNTDVRPKKHKGKKKKKSKEPMGFYSRKQKGKNNA